MEFGLLGRKLGHSYSPQLHKVYGEYKYELVEKEPEEIEKFMIQRDFKGLNVTIPYKKAVIDFCSELSEAAREIGSVNTVVKKADGTLFGDNTDAFGFEYMITKSGIDVSGKKVLILGSGGASLSCKWALRKMGASEIIVISRNGENNYNNIEKHRDAELIVNTTPVGMYPDVVKVPVDIRIFKNLSGVADIIYNPAVTELMFQAMETGVPTAGGLSMLAAQALKSAEQFMGKSLDLSLVDKAEKQVSLEMRNLVLVGMPGCGKSTVGKLAAEFLKREFVDSDEEIVKISGKTPAEIIESNGEKEFRRIESQCLMRLCSQSGKVISTGGGAVTVPENYRHLKRNSTVIYLRRDITKLATNGRPLSAKFGIEELFAKRKPLYKSFADAVIDNDGSAQETAESVVKEFLKQ